MDQSQTIAISLFQEGEYERAVEMMAKSSTITPEEFKKFVEQCNYMIAEQYKFLIQEELNNRYYASAHKLREEFRQKYGKNAEIDALPIPAPAMHSPSKPTTVASSPKQSTQIRSKDTTKSKSKDSSGSKSMYFIIGVAIIAIIIVLWVGLKPSDSHSSSSYESDEYVEDTVAIEEVIENEPSYNTSSDGYNSSNNSVNNSQENSYSDENYSDFE